MADETSRRPSRRVVSPLAVAAVPTALLGLCCGADTIGSLACLVAVVLAIAAAVHTAVDRTRVTGWPWVVVALCVSGLAIAGQMYEGRRHRAKAELSSCLSSLHQLAQSLNQYRADNDDRYPPSEEWTAAVDPKVVSPLLLVCPSDERRAEVSYAINARLAGTRLPSDEDEANAVLLFDADVTAPTAAGRQSVAYRHTTRWGGRGAGCNIAFADGHVKWIGRKDEGRLEWVPKATADGSGNHD